ncbi:MAG: hypothetical protein LC646_10250 [Xanthomonadaceae bacterium]|nr:hypothetical protein [Xanthomonadaceae bacterium]
MSTTWFPTGACDFKVVRLSKDQSETIRLELRAGGVKKDYWDTVNADIELALAAYRAMTGLAEESKPASVRKNLNISLNAALRLNDTLNDLDANSRMLLSQVASGGISKIHHHLSEIITALSEAGHKADELPDKGRLPDYARQNLAVAVLEALRSCGVAPTTTKDGLYNNLLAVVLEIATGKRASAVHKLATKAVKITKDNDAQLT